MDSLRTTLSRIHAWMLSALLISLVFHRYTLLTVRGQYTLSPVFALGGVIALFFLGTFLFSRETIKLGSLELGVGVFHVLILVGLCFVIFREHFRLVDFGTYWVQLLLNTMILVIVSNFCFTRRRDLRLVFRVWFLTGIAVSIVTVYQALLMNLGYWEFPLIPEKGTLDYGFFTGGYIRPRSLLLEPSQLALFLLPITFFSLVVVYWDRGKTFLFSRSLYNVFGTLLLLVALALSMSTAGYLIFCLALVVVLSRTDWSFLRFSVSRTALLGSFAIVLLALTIYLFGTAEQDPLARTMATVEAVTQLEPDVVSQLSTGRRLAAMWIAGKVWLQEPFVGVGLNHLTDYRTEFVPYWFEGTLESFGGVHNIWLQILAEAGLLGFVGLTVVWISAFQLLNRARELSSGPDRLLMRSMFYVLVVTFFTSLMNTSLIHPQNWIVLGLCSSFYFYVLRQNSRRSSRNP